MKRRAAFALAAAAACHHPAPPAPPTTTTTAPALPTTAPTTTTVAVATTTATVPRRRAAPPPPRVPASAAPAEAGDGALPEGNQGAAEQQLAAIRACEAGGVYSRVSRSGRYRGAYQFSRETWNGVASRHRPELVGVDPAAASPADQDAMAAALYGERGGQPWPNCP